MQRIILSILLLLALPAGAQNLVPNPGFEQFNACPQQRSTVVYSPDYSDFPVLQSWVSALENTTPDYYNYCATDSLVTLPNNTYNDYQHPRSGNACVGFSMMSGYPKDIQRSDYREYIEARLLQPLVAGRQYYLSFFVNMTYHIPWDYTQIVVDMIGARITDTQLNFSYPFSEKGLVIPGPSTIVNPVFTYLSDTAGWMKVSGTYTAHGGEQWLTIGYFRDSLPVHHILLYSPVADPDSIHAACYMYLDDVCLSEVQAPHRDTVCAAKFPVTLTAHSSAGLYAWSTGDSTGSIQVDSPGAYWLLCSDDCYFHTDTIVVLLPDQQQLKDTTVYAASFPFQIFAPFSGDSILWSTGSAQPEISVTAPGTYTVSIWHNCHRYIQSITVETREVSSCIWLPSAFTPDGDGLNDAFGPVYSCGNSFAYYSFSIFNRFGECVFYSEDVSEKWDGTYKSQNADVGAYYYMLRYSLYSGKEGSTLRKGDLTLIR